MTTLSGKRGEKSEFAEYWYCPKHGQILRREFEVRKLSDEYFAFHKNCGQKLKSLTYTRSNIFGDGSMSKKVTEALRIEHVRGSRRCPGGWMEKDNLDEVLRR